MINGVLIIDKPAGITSHDVVARCRRILKTKRIGHTGTLDPFATGVMVILVGQATRLAQFFDKDLKEYEAVVRFGFETDTGDKTGQLRITNYELRNFPDQEIKAALKDFRGEIEQTPPMYSAKKIEGKKLYELARKGIEVERKPVKVSIHELEIIPSQSKQTDTSDKIEDRRPKTEDRAFRVVCSAGTYIRVLAEDIGRKLCIGAHLAALRRTRAGKFDLSKAVTLEKLEEVVSENKLDEVLISMNEAVSHLPEARLSADEINKTKNGLKLRRQLAGMGDGEFLRMTDADENLISLGFYNAPEKTIQPKIVLI
jgi:tRNA pseudouridine55 synthase